MKRCPNPNCHESNPNDAIYCHMCGRKMKTRAKWPFVLIGIVAAALAVVFAVMKFNSPKNEKKMEFANENKIYFTVNGVSFNMVKVEGGTFQMGGNGSDASSDEQPVHSVELSSFYIGETEVTQELWEAVMGTSIFRQRDIAKPSGPLRGVGDENPMYYVNWYECQDFIFRLNQLTGKKFRLPTEAEWEYAARGGRKSAGNKFAGDSFLSSVAWYDANSNSETHPVKRKKPNELGLYDMSGNVWEWCDDRYVSNYYSISPRNNPKCDYGGTECVLRGGSWYSGPELCRITKRLSRKPDYSDTCFGFRLVMDY